MKIIFGGEYTIKKSTDNFISSLLFMDKKVYEFISQKTNDPIVERKTCAISGKPFAIYQSDLDFYDKVSPIFNGVKYAIPTPKLCPEERMRRRLAFRNERKLYRRNCDATGKQVISMYSEVSPYKVYDQKYRWSDAWDALEYGMDFDFSKRFNEQFSDLLLNVPSFNLVNMESTNSEYANHVFKLESCYMCFSSLESTLCINTWGAIAAHQCHDNCFIENSDVCFDCISCSGCHKLFHSSECLNCSDSSYLSNCVQCECCFNCSNLQNKKYCINNVQYTHEEYKKLLPTVKKERIEQIKICQNQQHCEDSYGNNMIGCSHCSFVSELSDSEYTKYTFDDGRQKNCYDCYGGSGCQYCLELMASAQSYKSMFICYGSANTNVLYSNKIYNCQDCFACVGLRNKRYCIFNKQYTKEEYEQLMQKIIDHMIETGEWGEFFSPSISPFGYNETVANDYYPSSKNEAAAKGYRRSEYESPFPKVEGIIQIQDLPSQINEIDDAILNKAIACEVTGKPFRIVKAELDFYRTYNIPLPRRHPDIRHADRMRRRPSSMLHLRNCMLCKKEMLSAYPSSYDGKVYCEKCYSSLFK